MSAEYREEPCRSALNRVQGMGFKWSLNPYMGCVHRCTFCYVRAFEKRADRPSDERYGTSIRVKTNVAEVLRRELRRRSWEREIVAIGAATDPYQPAEGRYKLTRGCLEVLGDFANPIRIITRGPMIVRDIDVLARAAERASVAVTFSVPTLDHEIWQRTEPGTAPPHKRLRALKHGVWANLLHLKPGTKEHFLASLERDWPELLPGYARLYGRRAYLSKEDSEPVRARVRELTRVHGIRDRRRVKLEPPEDPEQLQLAV